MLHSDSQLVLYKVQIMQQLFINDLGKSIKFCNIFQQLLHENHENLSNLIIIDKANFNICSVVNKYKYYF